MSTNKTYLLPKVWVWKKENGSRFSKINRPTSGATHKKELPKGKHNLQLYSQGTPNGVKITILLEELLELGIKEAEYDAWLIEISKGDQFGSGFVDINPNSKIPALIDFSYKKKPIVTFESGSILFYLAEKFQSFIPKLQFDRTECMNWLFWQMGSAPYLGGGFGHFYAYANEKYEYSIDRYAMETKRQLDVLDKHLSKKNYFSNEYSIADIAIWSWYGQLVLGKLYNAEEFLNVKSYKNVLKWAEKINKRPAVKRGKIVNKISGNPKFQLRERHSAQDFEKLNC